MRNVAQTLAWYKANKDKPPFDPDGMCLKVVRTARNIGAVYSSALKAQQATPAKHRITALSKIKSGMVMYFDDPRDGNPYGHIVTVQSVAANPKSLADINVWTNSVVANKIVLVKADYFPRHWGDAFVFASDWLNGKVLTFPKAPAAPAPMKTVAQIAKEVIAGKWGNGPDRVKRLKAAGYAPAKVQAKVNALLSKPPTTTSPKGEQPIKTKFTKPTIDGVDISRYQSGKIDYAAAKKAGVKFIWHKVTEGNRTVWQAQYDKRRKEAAAAGIPFGAYHFARAQAPTKTDATSEAKHFLSKAKPKPGDLKPVLDLETTEGLSLTQLRQWAQAFVAEVHRQGFDVVVYTNFDLGSAIEGCLLWTARYSNTNTLPILKNWDIWQFSNGVYGSPRFVPGFGNVDINTVRAGLKMSDLLIPKGK